MRVSRAVLVGLALVIAAVFAGFGAGTLARPAPRTPVPTTPEPAVEPTPTPDSGPMVFQQPLAAGCATSEAVWVVSEGGGIGRFDGERWALVDPTLRSLLSVLCGPNTVVAVGPLGRFLTIDERARSIRVDDLGLEDLFGIAALPDGALVVGTNGTVQRQTGAGWQPYAAGLAEDLFGVVAFSGNSAWVVGSRGAAYRLESAGWRPIATGATSTLRALTAASASDAVAAGDDGTLLRFDGRWRPLSSGVTTTLRGAARLGPITWIVGDRGVVLAVEGTTVTRFDLGTTCTLRGVFTRGDEVWIVGSDGLRGAVWRRAAGAVQRWGVC